MATIETRNVRPGGKRVFIRRHSLTVRLSHWLNVLSMTVLLFMDAIALPFCFRSPSATTTTMSTTA